MCSFPWDLGDHRSKSESIYNFSRWRKKLVRKDSTAIGQAASVAAVAMLIDGDRKSSTTSNVGTVSEPDKLNVGSLNNYPGTPVSTEVTVEDETVGLLRPPIATEDSFNSE